MSVIQVSRAARLALENRFAGVFNAELAAACEEFEIQGLGFQIDFLAPEPASEPSQGAEPPAQNFYRGDRTLESLLQHQEPDLPALAMWMGGGSNQKLQMTRTFSGYVAAYWRWFLYSPMRKSGLVELGEAVQHAMIATLEPELVTLNYRGDLSWADPVEQKLASQDSDRFGWVQEILYTASFEVNV